MLWHELLLWSYLHGKILNQSNIEWIPNGNLGKLRDNSGLLKIWIVQQTATAVIGGDFVVFPNSIQIKSIRGSVLFCYSGSTTKKSRNSNAIANGLIQRTNIVERSYDHLAKGEMRNKRMCGNEAHRIEGTSCGDCLKSRCNVRSRGEKHGFCNCNWPQTLWVFWDESESLRIGHLLQCSEESGTRLAILERATAT